MFRWQFNDGQGWRGGDGIDHSTVAAAKEAAKGFWHRFPDDHLRVIGAVSENRSSTGYLTYWWQDGQQAEERIADHGI